MKIKEQVVSLELSKKLKALGVEQESEFEWYTKDYKEDETWITNDPCEYATFGDELICSAFTASELGEMLPSNLNMRKFLYMWKDDANLWRIVYCSSNDLAVGSPKPDYQIEKDTLPNAMAKMLIYLLENHLVSVKAGEREGKS